MPKTQDEWKAVGRMTEDQMLERVADLGLALRKAGGLECSGEGRACDMADEAIVILLGTLRDLITEKRWVGLRPMDLFESTYGLDTKDLQWSLVLTRFQDTEAIVKAYRSSSGEAKEALKNKLVARGFI